MVLKGMFEKPQTRQKMGSTPIRAALCLSPLEPDPGTLLAL